MDAGRTLGEPPPHRSLARCCLTAPVGASVFAFALLLLLILLDTHVAEIAPYYVIHLFIAVEIFLLGAGLHHLFVHGLGLSDGSWLCGFLSALPFYVSREVRDREKLGYWDWPGLWWPTIGIVVLLFALEIGSALRRRRRLGQPGAGAPDAQERG